MPNHVYINCDWEETADRKPDGSRRVKCKQCGYITKTFTTFPILQIRRECPKATAADWPELPGSELVSILKQLGFQTCGVCLEFAERMNAWGVDGCREHSDEISAHLLKAYENSAWTEKLKAGGLAVALGLPLSIGGLLDLAIERAIPRP